MLRSSLERRASVPRRCAWCLRFCVDGTWIDGRRDDDGVTLPAMTHTICEECVAELRRQGLGI